MYHVYGIGFKDGIDWMTKKNVNFKRRRYCSIDCSDMFFLDTSDQDVRNVPSFYLMHFQTDVIDVDFFVRRIFLCFLYNLLNNQSDSTRV